MLIITLLAGFLPAVLSESRMGAMITLAWARVIASGISTAVYFFGLAKAFRASDFKIIYPVARALFIAIIDVTRGRYLTLAGWMGIILVVMGSALVPQRNFWDFQLRNYLNRASFWMLIAALGCYTFLDKIAAEVVQSGPGTAARYGYFYFAI